MTDQYPFCDGEHKPEGDEAAYMYKLKNRRLLGYRLGCGCVGIQIKALVSRRKREVRKTGFMLTGEALINLDALLEKLLGPRDELYLAQWEASCDDRA